jgi:hypothetical protein
MSRKERAFEQNIYLLDVIPTNTPYEKKFRVVGTTGNTYTVRINENPSCTCPDNRENYNTCKHLYFILLRVMRIKTSVRKYWSKTDLMAIFQNMPQFIENQIVMNSQAKQKYDNLNKNIKNKIKQRFDDICPICLDTIDESMNNSDYCKNNCGKSVHTDCFNIWMNATNKEIRCIFCDIPWFDQKCIQKESDHYNNSDYESDSNSFDSQSTYSEYNYAHGLLDYDIPINEIINNERKNMIGIDLRSLKVVELQERCKLNKLPYYGTKQKLVERLENYLNK